ncbi:class I SAM-dependent methyltransferase [Dyella choica]|uniref:Class I SAM-dependent methyltransferase n=1 Tax=Dyella choica TaxID=1927959 RepID=A0A432M6R5_9GAMM|nr:class I SAM-dependent methyltransferase [Dyella choica]RUL76131.1 class I SAM-dependent methyltransferase [Dyella choica]
MQQTPVNQIHNQDVLNLMPLDRRRVVEIGCSSGVLAREYKKRNPHAHYVGVDIVPEYTQMAAAHCDEVLSFDIESKDKDFLRDRFHADCWVFADVLEHLRDPWQLLAKLREIMPADGCLLACVPNVQHWSIQARLSCGDFRYEPAGLLDRTHLRWFTRVTLLEMFQQTGFGIVTGITRMLNNSHGAQFAPYIRAMAQAAGGDPEQAVQDANVFQFVVKAIPV